MSTKYLNTDNILKKVYDPSTEGLRTTAVASFVGGTVDISISDLTDSIKIGDGSGVYLDINPDGSINSNVEIDAADGDNIAISDGTNIVSVNINNELNVRDNDANNTLSSIDSKLNTLGQKNSAGSVPVVISSDQTDLPIRDLDHIRDNIAIAQGGNEVEVTSTNKLQITDISDDGGIQGFINVTTTPIAVRVGVNNLSNRKTLTAQKNSSGTIYWGYDNTVTPTTGTPFMNNQFISWAVGPNTTIYMIANSGTHNVRVTESA